MRDDHAVLRSDPHRSASGVAMNADAFVKISKASYFRIAAARPEERLEFVRGRLMQQMTGGTRGHSRIADRFAEALGSRLDTNAWIALRERGVETPDTVRYADVVIEPADGRDDTLATDQPVLIVEVLSQSSSERDIILKPVEYGALPSLAAYIVADQSEPRCLIWARAADGAFALEPPTVEGLDAVVEVPALGLVIPLSAIYTGRAPGSARTQH